MEAAVGPAIGIDHYEVGDEVIDAVADGTGVTPVARRSGGRPHLDLPATVTRHLRALGVGDVEESGVCTACEPERFFSYRRDGVTGRQALIAVRRE